MAGARHKDPVRHAEQYPFDIPDRSYAFTGGSGQALLQITDQRTPVLALGSNASPGRLKEKFGDTEESVFVTSALIYGYVVVYSAHFSHYGSLPATLRVMPGAVTRVFVTWLTDEQLETMHDSESLGVNYDFVTLEGTKVDVDGHGELSEVTVYKSRAGSLTHKGGPVGLAEVPSTNCSLPSLTQPAMLRCVHRRLASDLNYRQFMERIIHDHEYRRDSGARLREAH